MKILLAAGASGGHIHPACALAEELIRQGGEVMLVVPSSAQALWVPASWLRVRFIPLPHIRRGLRCLRDTAVFVSGAAQTLRAVLGFRPSVVVAFGGMASIPSALSALAVGVPVVVHEQNVLPGTANRFLARFAESVAVSFPGSSGYFPKRVHTVCTGNPMRTMNRTDKSSARRFFGLEEDAATVLITGGSQGSSRINAACSEGLCRNFSGMRIQVIHIAGKKEEALVRRRYDDAGIAHRTFGFLNEMEQAYSAADVAVTRAGAGTLSELVFFRLPAIIVPYPFASNHQALNAAVLENRGACLVIRDGDLSPELFASRLQSMLSMKESLAKMRSALEAIDPGNPAVRLAEQVFAAAAGRMDREKL